MEHFLSRGGYVFSFDIKQGYHHVDMHPDSIPYLGFAWEIDGSTRYFVFLVLPFGLTSAPFIFTKIVRALVKFWRSQGVRICVFIDDGLGTKEGYSLTKMDAKLVRESLGLSGFVANHEKSHWDPTQELTWLGNTVNLDLGTYTVSKKREDALLAALDLTSRNLPFTSARKLAKLTGKIISSKWILGDIIHLKTRHLYRVITTRKSWDGTLSLNRYPEAITEIIFWKKNFKTLNTRGFSQATCPTVIVASDASATGLGAHIQARTGEFTVQKNLTPEEQDTSSAHREVLAILYGLDSLRHLCKGQSILWYTDNWSASRIVRKGSPVPQLHEMAEKIYEIGRSSDIELQVEWIPREMNHYADYLSKVIDHDDWQTSPGLFRYIDHKWGPHTIDRFASSSNSKIRRFNSKYLCPNTEQVNAFTVHWEAENNFLVPPVTYIPKVLSYMKSCRAKGTLLAPYWPSAAFYPLLFPDGFSPAPFVIAWEILPYRSGLVTQGENKDCFIGSEQFVSDMLVVRIKC